MDQAAFGKQLTSLIETETERASALLELLQRERGLIAEDAEALEQAAGNKQALVQELEQLHRQRSTLLAQAGFADGHQGMRQCIDQWDADGNLAAGWERLMDRVRQCRDANQANGAMVEVNRRGVSQALGILRGQVPGSSTYGPGGRPADGESSRPLAKA